MSRKQSKLDPMTPTLGERKNETMSAELPSAAASRGGKGGASGGQWGRGGVIRCSSTQQRLESAVFNAVSLGQWELARALLTDLATRRDGHGSGYGEGERLESECRRNARELLKLVIMGASNFWSYSVAIPTPHHLSWLAFQTYNSLFPSTKDQLPDYVRKLIEFRLLLSSVLSNSSSSAISVSSTLCRYHSTHVLEIPGTVPEPVSPFQSAVLSFLHNILITKPTTGHALIRSLTTPQDSSAHLTNNESLQMLYMDGIHESLEAILQLKLPLEAMETDSDSQYESDHNLTAGNHHGRRGVTKECRRLTNLVYDLLSLMDPRPEMTQVMVDKLFVFLLKMNHRLGPDIIVKFEPSKIYSCLVGRSTTYLVGKLHGVEEYLRSKKINSSGAGGGVGGVGGGIGGEESNSSLYSLRLLRETESSGDWRALFYHVYHDQKHFLECVLDIGLQLIRVGRIREASELLTKPEFVQLRPALLLLAWDIFPSDGTSGKVLTEALWPTQLSLSQPLLYEGCCRLAFQVELVQWCLDKTRPHLLPSSSSSAAASSSYPPAPSSHHSHRAGDMFEGLETHSVLYILHHFTPLASLDPLEVIEILKHRPRVPSLSIPLTPPPQFSRGPTPLKPSKETEGSSPIPQTSIPTLTAGPSRLSGQVRPEQGRDMALFRGFRALKLVLDALWAAVQIKQGLLSSRETENEEDEKVRREDCSGKEEKEKKGRESLARDTTKHNDMRQKHSTAVRKLEFGETNGTVNKEETKAHEKSENTNSSHSSREQLYTREVLDRLHEAKTYISLLYPLNYRLEILENIFSLLFLSSGDLRPLSHLENLNQQRYFFSGGRHGSTASSNGPDTSLNPPPPPPPPQSSLTSDTEFSTNLPFLALVRSKQGFLVGERVAADLLSVLQDSMFEMRAARYALSQSTTSGQSHLQPDSIKSSISPSLAQQRAAKLEQYANEARWRLQLVSSKSGIGAGSVGVARDEVLAEVLSSSGVESGTEESESDSEMEEKKERERKRRKSQTATLDPTSISLQPTLEIETTYTPFISSKAPSTILLSTRSPQIGRVSPIPSLQPSASLNVSSTTQGVGISPSPRIGDSGSRFRQRGSPRPETSNDGADPVRHPRQLFSTTSSSSFSQHLPSSDQKKQRPLLPATPLRQEQALDSGEWADVEEKSPQHVAGRTGQRKKRLRSSRSLQAAKKRLQRKNDRPDAGNIVGSTVPQMLSSPGSLLRMCLSHTNYSRAREVIKMFEMEGEFGESLVQFSEHYDLVCQELEMQSRANVTPKISPSLTPGERNRHHRSPSSSSISTGTLPHPDTHLHVAIVNATSSSSALESLHRLLAPSSLHRMLLSGDQQLEKLAEDSSVVQSLTRHVPSLVMLDVVSSVRTEGQVARRIVEEASGRCQSVLESLTARSRVGRSHRLSSSGKKTNLQLEVHLSGPFSLLQTFTEVSGYFTTSLPPPLSSSSSSSQYSPSSSPSLPVYHSPHSLLSSFLCQLRTASVVDYKSFHDSYQNARVTLGKRLDEKSHSKSDVISTFTQSGVHYDEPQKSLAHVPRKTNFLDSMFDELVEVLEGGSGRQSLVIPGSPRHRALMRRTLSFLQGVGPASPEVGGVSMNFVLQFSQYLGQLMDLLMRCLAPSPSALSEGALLVSILEESPSRLIGRLVFEVGVAPEKLEKLTSSFHNIRMMEVLVRYCCPQLPAHTLSPRVPLRGVRDYGGDVILALNNGGCGSNTETITDLCVFSENLLNQLLTLLKENATAPDSLVATDTLLTIFKSEKMKSLISRAACLSSVDLRTLTTPTERISFFSNVVNFLYIHCVMYCVAEDHGEESGVLSRSKITLSELERSSLLQAGVFGRLGYRVGQLGVVSVHDLHHVILRRGLSPPLSGRDTPLLCRIAPVKPDPWMEYSPSSSDPRVLYLIHPGPVSSPQPLPLHPDVFSSTLATAEKRYLSQNVRINVSAKEVTVPELLYQHRDDFAQSVSRERHGNTSLHYLPDLSLLHYLQSHLDPELAELIHPLVTACETAASRKHPLPVKISVSREERRMGYQFHQGTENGTSRTEGDGMESVPPTSPRRRMSRLRSNETDVSDSLGASSSLPRQLKKGYSFTPEIMTFVTHQNHLLAALIHLLSPPPPTPPSLTLPSSSAKKKSGTGTGVSEEEGTTGGGVSGEMGSEGDEREESTRRPAMFRSRVKSQLTRRTSYNHHTPLSPSLSSWQRDLDDVLVQFVTLLPMQRYLLTRLANFNSVLSWDLLPADATSSSSSSSSNSTSGGGTRRSRGDTNSALPSLRVLALLPSRGPSLGVTCNFTVHRLMELDRIQDAVDFLSSEPASCHRDRISLLSDIILSSAFVRSYSEILSLGQSGEMAGDTLTTTAASSSSSSSSSPLSLLFQLTDHEMAAHLVLASLHNWPVEICRDLLSLVSHHLLTSSPLLPLVRDKLQRMKIYSTIMTKCRTHPLVRSGRDKKEEVASWTKWTELARESENKPQFVLEVLMTEKQFQLARDWAKIHSIPTTITQQIEVDYLSTLLEARSPDPMSAHRVLDSLLEDKLRLRVCETVLQQRLGNKSPTTVDNVETTIFILHYITSKLAGVVKETQRMKYINQLLGAKALLSLPTEERKEYRHLMEDAALLVEQLLINKKTELAAVVVKELRKDRNIGWITVSDMPRNDSSSSSSSPPSPSSLPVDDENDPFTTLIVFYASKALEFPKPVLTSSINRSYSAASTAQSTRPTSPGGHTQPPTVPLSPFNPTEPPSRASFTHRRRRSSQTPISPTPAAYHTAESSTRYEPPVKPPPKEKWEPDTKTHRCPVCMDVSFGMFNRRHHCRRCGRVVCARCSPHLCHIEGYDRSQRTCKDCHSFIQKTASIEESGVHHPDYQASLGTVYPSLFSNQRWRLITNDDHFNTNLRSEFYYEESPNWTLCLTLVDLLLSRRLAAAYLLDRCHSVSLHLVSHGNLNHEIDHYFVIGMIQNLLWSAKLRFEEATDLSGVEICDTYLSRVDLLRQLVSSRSRVIPSIQELAKPELARRVRDRLVQEDQYHLAMEVSTKCQMDTSIVWSAWGLACLRCGELEKAREKFKHFFQMSSQRGSGATPSRRSSGVGVTSTQQLLERIIDQLEQNPLSITTKSVEPPEDWTSVMNSCTTLTEKYSEDCDLDTHRFSECLHYLTSYAGHSATVAFFVRHNCWTNACKYILDERCSEEVFVEQLWVPALRAGVIEKVQEIVRALNHSLVQWEPYLTAVCRYFSQRALYHILYQTQLFMRDFIRAGMTCTKFFIGFSGRNTTITELYSRRHYLTTAQRHFQSALDAKQQKTRSPGLGGAAARGGRGSHTYLRGSPDEQQPHLATSTKNMSIADLKSHITTIDLQMRVTEFMYKCAKSSGNLESPLTSSGEGGVANGPGGVARKAPQPITLFSSGHTRGEVAVQLMLRCQDLLEGFELAARIVTNYRLPASNIFCETSKGLAAARSHSNIRLLLDCVNKSSFASDSLNDEILMAAIKVLSTHSKETKQVEKLVQLIRNERSKIKALVQCGKLKNAYLTAIKSRMVDEVINISQIAEKAGQLAVRDICNKWLQTNGVPPRN